MAIRIEVGFKKGVRDVAGEVLRRRIVEDLGLKIGSVRTISVYTIDKELSPARVEAVRTALFTDLVIQESSVIPLADNFDWLVEVGYWPGVTDNTGRTSQEAIEDLLKIRFGPEEAVYTSRQYLLKGALQRQEVEAIARGLLANEIIERWEIKNFGQWDKKIGMGTYLPKVKLNHKPKVEEVDLNNVTDEELERLGREGISGKGEKERRGPLALNLEEMKVIRAYFNRPEVIELRKKAGLGESPTDVELESIAQTQSEHCKHKIFNGLLEYRENGRAEEIDSLFKTYIQGATEEIRKKLGKEDWCVSVFGDNSGVIRLNEDWNLTFKVETHNSPSALDPYGGAITGIVGVNRDPLGTGKGSKLILNMYGYCFAPPFIKDEILPYRAKNKEKQLLHPRRIFEGVRKGVEDGGNKSGIPTAWGFLRFHEGYLGKPLVYVGTLGIMPAWIGGKPSHVKKARPGDLIVMVGGRIGKDGIHGATFSSESLHVGSPATAAQIGDPITQKKMHDMLIEARDRELYNSITDNGAGGLSSSVGEMARESNGCLVDLTEAPLKYEGLDPWEIWLSEAQERMTLALKPDKLNELMKLAEKWGVEVTVIGKFTDGGKCQVKYQGRTIMFVELDFLHEGLPRRRMKAEWKPVPHQVCIFEEPGDLTLILKEMLSRLNICSWEYVARQYDHEVQGMSAIKPLIGVDGDVHSEAAVLKPLRNSREGIILTTAIQPNYSALDTYYMAAAVIDEAIRNVIAVGGSLARIALLDNFCWSGSNEPRRLAQLKRAAQACYDYAIIFGTPFISGKDSMFNDFHGFDAHNNPLQVSIPPTLLISALGIMKDVRKCLTLDVKMPGDLVYVLGETGNELGASEYYTLMGEKLRGKKYVGNHIPKVNARKAKGLYKSLAKATGEGLVASGKNCVGGGLGVALARMSFAGGKGIEVDLSRVPRKGRERNDTVLFSESPSRLVVTVPADREGEFEKLMRGNVWARIGRVRNDKRFLIRGLEGQWAVEADIDELKKAYKKPLRWR